MGALRLVLHAELRRRRRAWLALALLVAVVGGVVLAAAAAGRRTADAFPSYLSRYGFDVALYTTAKADLSRFPEVARVTEAVGPDNGQPTCACSHPINPASFGLIWYPGGNSSIDKLVAGHVPDPSSPYEVLASYTMAQDFGLHIGSVIRVPLYAASQTAAYDGATGPPPPPTGPTVALHITGFEATEFDFPSGATPSFDLDTTPAFARRVLPHLASGYVALVRLRHGAADLPRFARDTGAIGEPSPQDAEVASVESAIHPQAVGWWVLAALASVVGLAVMGQALFRQSAVEAVDYPVLGALGGERALMVGLGLARSVLIGVLGAVGAVAVAVALSPLSPLGEARVAEPHTGVAFDGTVLVIGALCVAVVVAALGTWSAWRAASMRAAAPTWPARPSMVVTRLAAWGAPPSVVVGARYALERRTGAGAVPVGTAVLGTVLAVTALSGTAVFGASLAHLDATPQLYGDNFQLNFTNPTPNQVDTAVLHTLEHDPSVAAITAGFATQLEIDGKAVGTIVGTSVRGPLLLSTVTGGLPTGPRDIGLGTQTTRQLHVHVGSRVRVTFPVAPGGTRTVPYTVVSQIAFPILGGDLTLGTGAALTYAGYADAVCTPGPTQAACRQDPFTGQTPGGLLVRVVPGAHGRAAVAHYLRVGGAAVALPITPTSLVNFGEAVNFPLIFGAMLAVSGAATLVHLLVVSVSRRRRDTWLLKAIGFVNSQVVAAVAWQATTVAVIGVVIGLPLGIVVGQAVWRAFAVNLGAVPVTVLQPWLLGALVVGVLVVTNLLATAPALAAARTRPEALRTP